MLCLPTGTENPETTVYARALYFRGCKPTSLQGLTFLGRKIVSFYSIFALVTFFSRDWLVIWKLFPTFQYKATRTTNLRRSSA